MKSISLRETTNGLTEFRPTWRGRNNEEVEVVVAGTPCMRMNGFHLPNCLALFPRDVKHSVGGGGFLLSSLGDASPNMTRIG